MKKYLKWFLIGVCVSVTFLTMHAPSKASGDLREDQTWWMVNGDQHQIEGFFFKDESILGLCSKDCYEIDLTLHDTKTQKEIRQDVDTSAAPQLTIPYDGTFTVEVQMMNCARSGGCRTWLEVADDV